MRRGYTPSAAACMSSMRPHTSVDRGRGWSTEWKSSPKPLPPFAALRRRSISPPPFSPPYISRVSLVSTPAVVLRTYRYSETSKIVRLATRDYGVQSAIAKGVLRPRSPFGAALETLSEGVAQLYHKETRELQTLAAFDVVQLRRDLADDLGRFAGAAALSEVMLKMAPPAPLPAAYQAFIAGLDALVRAEQGEADAVAVRWLWLLVGVLGFAPQLDACEPQHAHEQPEPAHRHGIGLSLLGSHQGVQSGDEGLVRGGQRRGRRHLEHHLRQSRGAGKAPQVAGEVAPQLDHVERREGLELACFLVVQLCDALAQRLERCAERAARPQHALRDRALYAIIARRETHDLGGLAVTVSPEDDSGRRDKTHAGNIRRRERRRRDTTAAKGGEGRQRLGRGFPLRRPPAAPID